MKYKLKIYSIWECGQRIDSKGNPHQEDSIYPAYEKQKDTDRLFILCDGMGGHESGEVASSTVCTAISQSIVESTPDPEGDFNDEHLLKAIEDAFNALDALPSKNANAEKKMGTTMTLLKFHNKGCTIAHMGDSRVYHIRPGRSRKDTEILFKTSDHSLVNDLIKVGELTPEEAKSSKQKNIITRAMQPKMERRPKPDIYHTSDIKKGDYFYMCSDGMLEQMEDENLLFIFSETTGDNDNKVKILTQATNENSDNHSAIIVRIIDVIDPLPLETESTTSIARKPKPIMAEIEEKQQTIPSNKTKEKYSKKKTSFAKFLFFILLFIIIGAYVFLTTNNKQESNGVDIINPSEEPIKEPEKNVQKEKREKQKDTPQISIKPTVLKEEPKQKKQQVVDSKDSNTTIDEQKQPENISYPSTIQDPQADEDEGDIIESDQ